MESCSKQKSVKPKHILFVRFFKVSTLCLDDSFAHSLHSLNQLHEVPSYINVRFIKQFSGYILGSDWLRFCIRNTVSRWGMRMEVCVCLTV